MSQILNVYNFVIVINENNESFCTAFTIIKYLDSTKNINTLFFFIINKNEI